MKYTSDRKNKADDQMTKATRRFKDDEGFEEGDWGRADKKYAPGATYESEENEDDKEDKFLRSLNSKHDPGSTYQKAGHKPVTVQHQKNGMYYAWRGKENVGTASLHHHGHLTSVSVMPDHKRSGVATALYNHIEKHSGMKLKPSPRYVSKDAKAFWANRGTQVEGANMSVDLLRSVLTEAAAFAKLPITKCDVCGKTGHPAAAHQAKALSPEAKTSRNGKRLKETEIPGNDAPVPCDACGKLHAPSVPCKGRKELDELGEAWTYPSFFKFHVKK
jgi:uncharacterized OB-fold protein